MRLNMSSNVQKEQTCQTGVHESISMLLFVHRNPFIVRDLIACNYSEVDEFP